jgi:hypothetical protein
MLANQGPLPVRMRRAHRFSFLTAMPATNDRGDGSPRQLEAAARAAIELRADRTLTDAEWAAMRARILEFAGVLRVWERKMTGSGRGNVEVLCQREPYLWCRP